MSVSGCLAKLSESCRKLPPIPQRELGQCGFLPLMLIVLLNGEQRLNRNTKGVLTRFLFFGSVTAHLGARAGDVL